MQSQQYDPHFGLLPGEVTLGPAGEQFFAENTNCPDPIVASECKGGIILRYVDPADPERLTPYACVGSPARRNGLPLLIRFHGSHELSADDGR